MPRVSRQQFSTRAGWLLSCILVAFEDVQGMGNMSVDKSLAGNILITAASVVIVIAGIKSSASILIPFLLSIFIAILSAPVMHWLTR